MNLIKCFGSCGGEYPPEEMQATRSHVMQLCKKCHAEKRKERRVALHNTKQAELRQRMWNQRQMRADKAAALAKQLDANPSRKPRKREETQLIKTHKKIENIKADMELKRELEEFDL